MKSGRPDCEWQAREAQVGSSTEKLTDCGKFNGSMDRWRSTPSRWACKLAACVELATPHIQLKLKDIFVYSQGITDRWPIGACLGHTSPRYFDVASGWRLPPDLERPNR
jgi:hypothetical protein